jgi:hypothetical protein
LHTYKKLIGAGVCQSLGIFFVLDTTNATVFRMGRIAPGVTIFQRMNRTIAPDFGKQTTLSLRRSSRVFAAIIGIFLLTVGSAQAEPVQINRVIQTLKNLQGTTDIQLTLISQDPAKPGTKSPAPTTGTSNGGVPGSNDPKVDVSTSGFPIVADIKIGVDDIGEEGEVDGTICDCGEVLIAGGGFPKWPLLFLAAVPLAFIPDCDDCDQSEPTPTPTPTPTPQNTPTPTPEPASLLIFGTGLAAVGAGLRRRYHKAKLAGQIDKTEEEQS